VNTNTSRRCWRAEKRLPLGLILIVLALGCSRTSERHGPDVTDGGAKMVEMDPEVTAALTRMEATGRLEGVEFEHYVGGGLPPPHYRSDQFRLLTRDGHDVVQFAAPNYSAKPDKDASYPLDKYWLPAQPEDVKKIARILREGRAFDSSAPRTTVADAVRTELVFTIVGKDHKATYWGLPPALTALDALVDTLIARVKSQGQHKLEP
jgi:hypothetical protein